MCSFQQTSRLLTISSIPLQPCLGSSIRIKLSPKSKKYSDKPQHLLCLPTSTEKNDRRQGRRPQLILALYRRDCCAQPTVPQSCCCGHGNGKTGSVPYEHCFHVDVDPAGKKSGTKVFAVLANNPLTLVRNDEWLILVDINAVIPVSALMMLVLLVHEKLLSISRHMS
ncbi:hypothetical protein CEXT_579251 [Caerostris extrusa]|uniref:Uncharacterized protein n=1 Tax=Caerostris extrusa TaxID=172846 RepID=A0AAV4T534_CAEEX|nr:hypothetical protein CEXT_579251 [Caerostris extrusa]